MIAPRASTRRQVALCGARLGARRGRSLVAGSADAGMEKYQRRGAISTVPLIEGRDFGTKAVRG